MPKIKVNDISLYYEEYGHGEPILLIAGFAGDHMAWSGIVAKLSQYNKVIVFDNRGSGQSDIPAGPYSIQQLADDAYQLCLKLGISSANIVGNSMGGFIAQTLAYTYPSFVKSLVISNSAMKANPCFNVYLLAYLELRKASAPMKSLFKGSLSWVYSAKFLSIPNRVDELVEISVGYPYAFTIEGYEAQLVALNEFDSTLWADKIKAPTLVVGSEQDLIFNPERVKLLANTIPKAKYYEFKGLGHLPFIEEPDQFVGLLKDFF